jgi:hypothetical protein
MTQSSISVIPPEQERDQWSLMKDQSEILIQSKAIPSAIENLPQAMAILQYGRELGLPPMTSFQNISLIKGKPTLSAHLIGARLKNAGHDYYVKEFTDTKVEICFLSKNEKIGEQCFTYTAEDAKTAGNFNKDNYKKYPKQMLYARCLTLGGRIVAPEVLAGIYAPEEFNEENDSSGSTSQTKQENTREKVKVEEVPPKKTPKKTSKSVSNKKTEEKPKEEEKKEEIDVENINKANEEAMNKALDRFYDLASLLRIEDKATKDLLEKNKAKTIEEILPATLEEYCDAIEKKKKEEIGIQRLLKEAKQAFEEAENITHLKTRKFSVKFKKLLGLKEFEDSYKAKEKELKK